MFVFNRDFRYVYIHQVICACSIVHYSEMKSCAAQWYVMWEELSFDHFLKHSNHLKQALKMFQNGTVHFVYCLTFNLLTTALLPW